MSISDGASSTSLRVFFFIVMILNEFGFAVTVQKKLMLFALELFFFFSPSAGDYYKTEI